MLGSWGLLVAISQVFQIRHVDCVHNIRCGVAKHFIDELKVPEVIEAWEAGMATPSSFSRFRMHSASRSVPPAAQFNLSRWARFNACQIKIVQTIDVNQLSVSRD
jgi:hypothetical protein